MDTGIPVLEAVNPDHTGPAGGTTTSTKSQ